MILTEDIKMDIRIKRTFAKQYEKAPKNIQSAFDQRIVVFRQDPFHPFFHNHALTGSYKGYRSINVTGDWRALYKEVPLDENKVIIEFHLLGTHSQLYR